MEERPWEDGAGLHRVLSGKRHAAAEAVVGDRWKHWDKQAAATERFDQDNNTSALYGSLRRFYKPRVSHGGHACSEEVLAED